MPTVVPMDFSSKAKTRIQATPLPVPGTMSRLFKSSNSFAQPIRPSATFWWSIQMTTMSTINSPEGIFHVAKQLRQINTRWQVKCLEKKRCLDRKLSLKIDWSTTFPGDSTYSQLDWCRGLRMQAWFQGFRVLPLANLLLTMLSFACGYDQNWLVPFILQLSIQFSARLVARWWRSMAKSCFCEKW